MITAALNPLAHGPNPVAIPLAMRPFPAATSLPGIASPLTAIVTRWVPPTPPLPVGFFSRFFRWSSRAKRGICFSLTLSPLHP